MAKETEKMIARQKNRASAQRRWRSAFAAMTLCVLGAVVGVSPASANVGLESFTGNVFEEAGTTSTQAGGHPYKASTTFYVAKEVEAETGFFYHPKESFKDAIISLPPGFVGNPQATPQCTASDLNNYTSGIPACPRSSQVGVISLDNYGFGFSEGSAVYNMVPPPGKAAAFGFVIANVAVTLTATVRTGGDYGVDVSSLNSDQTLAIIGVQFTFWGNPADHSHDSERGGSFVGPPLPFIGAPSNCSAGPLTTSIRINSWQDQGTVESLSFNHNEAGEPLEVTNCEAVPFAPSITALPTTNQADSPTGLSVNVHLPQGGYENVDATGTGYLKKATVTLPEGMTVNPASANGLGSCSEAQIDLNGSGPANCPDNSKLGDVEITTPVLDHPVKGSVYLAAQKQNKFGSLLATYIAVDDPQTGIVVKLAGRIESDAQTGRITATFDENPQLPFEDLNVDFFGGSNAPLRTPATCGTYATTGAFSSWSAADPNNPTAAEVRSNSSSFEITSGPSGKPCPTGQFDPKLIAGTANPFAATYSPFSLRLTREDGTQPLNGLSIALPRGLTGKLAGIPYCSDAALAGVSGDEGTGAAQLVTPACPAGSQLGTVTVGAGAGPTPFYVDSGKAYLAGPYKGAPLSMAIVTPAVAGPFDLGNVVVRTALRVDPESAQITAVSDPIPTIVHGIPLDLRDVRVNIDRQGFTLNPTNCDELAFTGSASSPSGATAPLSDRFQAVSCAALGFAPKLSLSVKGGTKRGSYQRLKAVLNAKPGQANIGKVSVALPHSEFLAQEHIRTICTRVQFAADQCPAGSIYGKATAYTPLLDQPLSGPVYLRSSSHELPDLVAALHGQIDIDLVGRIDSVKGGIRNTFESVPDAPVSKFVLEMKGGKKSLLVNSRNLCRSTNRATVEMAGQNGKEHDFRPVLKSSCKQGKKSKKKNRGGR